MAERVVRFWPTRVMLWLGFSRNSFVRCSAAFVCFCAHVCVCMHVFVLIIRKDD